MFEKIRKWNRDLARAYHLQRSFYRQHMHTAHCTHLHTHRPYIYTEYTMKNQWQCPMRKKKQTIANDQRANSRQKCPKPKTVADRRKTTRKKKANRKNTAIETRTKFSSAKTKMKCAKSERKLKMNSKNKPSTNSNNTNPIGGK